jgi:adenine C2-methylase RlmN of 23S rRNA A2503 and tRNA A37
MKIKYKWYVNTREQRITNEYILLAEIEKQKWSSVLFLRLWKTVGLICIQ